MRSVGAENLFFGPKLERYLNNHLSQPLRTSDPDEAGAALLGTLWNYLRSTYAFDPSGTFESSPNRGVLPGQTVIEFTTSETARHRQVPTVPRACDSRPLPSSLPGRVRESARL